LSADDLLNPTTLKLSVFTPTPGGGTSTELNFTVGNPVPVLANLSPNSATAGGAGFTLAINGTGFLASSVVKLNGVDRAATFVNSTQLTIAMTADDIKTAGSAKIVVTNPPPVGGTSNELSLTINNPPPVATTLSQTTLTAGAGATMLTITGSGFRPESVARVNGSDRVTTFVSATELKVTLLGSDVASGAVLKLTVFTPTPGGGTSSELSLTVNNPTPTLSSLNPNSAFKGDPAFTLTINGTNFVPTSVVRWNGADRATTFVSSTQLQAAIPASDLANDGMADVTVFNPTPVGGTSSALKFTINPLTGFEADVTPRPTGDGNVSIADWVLVGRMASNLDTPQNSSEFQRADCAPTATSGDGRITIADWVQAGRYAAGLDPRVPAAGPSQPSSNAQALELRTEAAAFTEAQPELTRIVRARSESFVRGQLNGLPIELEGQGNENGLSFSLNFDAKQMLFSHLETAEGWTVNLNSEQIKQGRLGVMLMLSAGKVASLGKQTIATAYFAPLGGIEPVTTEVAFDDQVFTRDIADPKATILPAATFEKARLTITGRGFANVRAASYVGPDVAGDSIASAFGVDLATEVASAVRAPLPEVLAGTTVKVTDSKGVTKAAALFFVSPSQINYLLPVGLAEGLAQVTITNRAGVVSRGSVLIHAVAPSVFSADATGTGWAAADVVRVLSDGNQVWERTYRFDSGDNKFVPVPIDLGPERGKDSDKVFLVVYATGLRQHGDLRKVKLKVGETYLAADYAGQQGGYAGLDQINVLLPRSMMGRGTIPVEVLVNGLTSNQVKIQIR
ncbi:MAG TPA: IPT/TIG domain-containing protein, partial [Blastocatellia bacterium]|nr:IPT/TIG domain-containing protein [Blastocatellia bacterium]